MKKVIMIIAACLIPAISFANYESDLDVYEKNGYVKVSGRISGPGCDKLVVKVYAKSDDGDIISCTDVVEMFGRSTFFECKDKPVYKKKTISSREWGITNVFFDCKER